VNLLIEVDQLLQRLVDLVSARRRRETHNPERKRGS